MNRINFVNLLFKVILTLKMLMNLMMVRIITNERTGDERTEGQRNETKIIENLNLVIFEYCYSSPLHNKYLLTLVIYAMISHISFIFRLRIRPISWNSRFGLIITCIFFVKLVNSTYQHLPTFVIHNHTENVIQVNKKCCV